MLAWFTDIQSFLLQVIAVVAGHVDLDEACSRPFVSPDHGEPLHSIEDLKSIVSAMTAELQRVFSDIDSVAVSAGQGPAYQHLLLVLADFESRGSLRRSKHGPDVRPSLDVYFASAAAVVELSIAFFAR
jgi:hypothetical protein